MRSTSVWTSFGHAWAGLCYCFRTQRNARIHLLVAVVVSLLAGFLRLDFGEWAVLLLMVASVFVGLLILGPPLYARLFV